MSLELGRELIEGGRSHEAIGVLQGVLAGGPQVRAGAGNENNPTSSSNSDQDYLARIYQKNWARLYLASAYAWSDRLDEAKRTLDLELRSTTLMDVSVRWLSEWVRRFDDPALIAQERRVVEGLRRAGLRDHLDEEADSKVLSDGTLRPLWLLNSPTPMTVPGGTTVKTAEVEKLLAERKPLVLTTAITNPSLPGAIWINQLNSGSFNDIWQARLKRMMQELTGGDLQKPIITFAYSMNRWNSRNLALRLITLGYTHVYWYPGGWEAWNAHDLPKAPVLLQLR